MEKINKYSLSLKQFLTAAGAPGFMLIGYHLAMVFLTRRRSFDDVAAVDGSAMVQIIMAGTAFIIALNEYNSNKFTRLLLLKTPMKWLLFYGLWAHISTLWSVHPSMTAYRAFETIAYLLLFISVISRLYSKLPIQGIIQWVLHYAVFVIILNLLKRWYAYGLNFSVETLLMEQMTSTPYFFLALLIPVGLYAKVIILSISVFSLSNTAYAGMLLGVTTLFKGKSWVKILFFIIAITAFIFIIIKGLDVFLLNTIFYGKEGIGIEYTTGRDKIFELAFDEGLKRPFTGYGFVSGETFIITKLREGVIGAHNGLLSAFLGGGFPAVFIFIMLFIQMFRTANSRFLPPNYKAAFMSTVILIAIHTLGNPGIGTRVYGTWMPAVMIFTLISMVQLHFKYKKINENHLGNP